MLSSTLSFCGFGGFLICFGFFCASNCVLYFHKRCTLILQMLEERYLTLKLILFQTRKVLTRLDNYFAVLDML